MFQCISTPGAAMQFNTKYEKVYQLWKAYMNVKDKPQPCGETTRTQAGDQELVTQGTGTQESAQKDAQLSSEQSETGAQEGAIQPQTGSQGQNERSETGAQESAIQSQKDAQFSTERSETGAQESAIQPQTGAQGQNE